MNFSAVFKRWFVIYMLKQLYWRVRACDVILQIAACEKEDGIYILEMIKGKVAAQHGTLKVGDRILSISGVDMRKSTPEVAAKVITVSTLLW